MNRTSTTAFTNSTPLHTIRRPYNSFSSTSSISRNRRAPAIRAAFSLDLARAAAAAATLTLANVIYPTNVSVNAHAPQPNQQTRQHVWRTIHHTDQTAPVVAVIGVGKSSINDYHITQQSSQIQQQQQQQQQSPSSSSPSSLTSTLKSSSSKTTSISTTSDHFLTLSKSQTNSTSPSPSHISSSSSPSINSENDTKREFMLAIRLVTSVMMGVMLGIERRATTLNLGVRSVTVLSVTGALTSLLLSSTTTNGMTSSSLAFMSMTAAPTAAATAVLLAFLTTLAVLVGVRTRRRGVRFARSMSAVVGLVVGMGVACGAGLGLMTAGFYLGGIAVMRGDSTRALARNGGTNGFITTTVQIKEDETQRKSTTTMTTSKVELQEHLQRHEKQKIFDQQQRKQNIDFPPSHVPGPQMDSVL